MLRNMDVMREHFSNVALAHRPNSFVEESQG
jgi:hypothetical protein